MSFLNFALLGGLSAIAIPIVLHLLNRRPARVLDWGAMRFLADSLESRRRRIRVEEALLLSARCLLAGLLALAVARPFVPPGSPVPWGVVLPAFLLGVVSLTTALVLRENRRWSRLLGLAAVLLLGGAAAAAVFEKRWNLKRFGSGGGKDIVIILDSSASMRLRPGGDREPAGLAVEESGRRPDGADGSAAGGGSVSGTLFARAVDEARRLVEQAPPGSAFSLIQGAAVPLVRIPEPVVNRLEVVEKLADLKPARGRMAAFDALAAAGIALARGTNAGKEIIILTDGQNTGWETAQPARWEALEAGFGTLVSRPRVILRRFDLPASFRNAALSSIRYSREVVGVDRPVTVEVTVENTGTEAITPGGVDLEVDGETLTENAMGQLPPGGRQTVRFTHRFRRPGSVVLRAALRVRDDLETDNSAESVCQVTTRLGVLIVDGQGEGPFLQRAGSFTALALSPAEPPPAVDPHRKPAARREHEKEPEEDRGAVVAPEVLPLNRLGALESFGPWRVVVLADVPRLPAAAARRLTAWVQAGGGLLVTAGSRALPDFYNVWTDAAGQPFLPARLAEERIPRDPVGPAMGSFTHPALALVADSRQSDLAEALFSRWWRLDPSGRPDSFTAGTLANGDPFLTGRRHGFGMVLLAAVNFDTAGSNLPSRQAFVPLAHQLIYHLAGPDGQPLNQAPSRRVQIPLSASVAAGGLRGEYFRGRQLSNPALVRIDGALDFNWGNGAPGPGVPEDFTVRWTGSLVPRYSEEYFFDGWGDDQLAFRLDGEPVFERGGEGQRRLEAGKSYPVRLELTDRSGGAAMQLSWRSQSQERQIIPASVLTPFTPGAEDQETSAGRWEVTGPEGWRTAADLVFTSGGLAARLGADAGPGLYRMHVPPGGGERFRGLLDSGGTIPFTVTDDASESRLQPLTAPDLDLLRRHLDLLEAPTEEAAAAALTGRQFGEELWRHLAVAALVLLLAETALGRWIARSRQAGETGEAVRADSPDSMSGLPGQAGTGWRQEAAGR